MFESFGNWIAYQVIGLDAGSQLGQAVQFFVMDVVKIFVLLVVIIYVMGLLRAMVSPEKVRDIVKGKPKWMSKSLAIGLGAVTPFCSCSSVPLFIGFVEAGIPLSTTFAFLIASPMINEVAVVILASILGWKVALLYVLAGVVVAYVGSWIMDFFKLERYVESYVWNIQSRQTDENGQASSKMSLPQRHSFALSEVKEIVKRIWKWVLIGIAIGAWFHGYVPEEWIVSTLSSSESWWTVPAAVVVGVPLYSNATGVIPVIEAMLNKGVPIGTSLALMMSIAALSLPELLILRKVIQWPALAIFIGILAVSFTLVGWLFNFYLA
ncbi:permease [Thiomicrorhabdus sp. ZW0627]|uniref:permease n=1 Tax=Thiomicrorhabdus sp. ZW0627 TaxID=3039774 RepID=UPI0024370EB4|nr:permease [Thiomicrorhabdus sp. ZW0627]MDG6772815.1 permease [Thiomicrorhabdus sp. ZW0627]